MIRWGNFPRGSEVELFFSEIDVDEVLALARLRQGAPTLRKVDDNTLAVVVSGSSWIPVPGGRDANIASLITVRLPEGVLAGQHFTASVAQVSGVLRSVIGTFQLSVSIGKAADLQAAEVHNLSLLRYIALTVPPASRWYAIFVRYLSVIAGRVREFGVDPDTVEANPDGTGVLVAKPDDGPGGGGEGPGDGKLGGDGLARPIDPDGGPRPDMFSGKVVELFFDCFGDFQGFEVVTCSHRRIFKSHEPGVERVVRLACRDRTTVRVYAVGSRVLRLVLVCP